MQRFSVSFDDDLEAWIESKADKRGVSKAKIIRDSVESAQITGLIRNEDKTHANVGPLIERIERLEDRVDALESSSKIEHTEKSSYEESDDIVTAFKRELQGGPPQTEHGKAAITKVFELLLQEGPLTPKEFTERVYPEFESEYADEKSMKNTIRSYFSDIEAIEDCGYGMWDANPSVVDTTTANSNLNQFNMRSQSDS